ncbi:MAG TPA: OmpA family protein [Burkholderiaceae bacterium]|nr:OmpA family protein [Burkholderiaceae bacterium]
MLKFLIKPFVALALVLFAASAHAAKDPNDAEGTSDHPEVPRFPGYHIDAATHNDYNEFVFATKGFDAWSNGKGDTRAGKFWEIHYVINDGARVPSLVEIINNYDNAFKKVGGRMVRKDPQQGAVFVVPRGSGERWVQLDIYSQNYGYALDIVDVGEMAQKVEASAGEMADAIKKNGFVALHGILFDTGKATLRPESEPLLTEVVALLNRDKGLRLSVEGHTDNVGDKKSNLELSKKRAESVVRNLSAKGIDLRRLKVDGKGDTVPVADNRSEDGRAMNRRVELVKF